VKQGKIVIAGQQGRHIYLPAMQTTTATERMKGLLALPPLTGDEAFWISPCNSVHTFGMAYELDLIFVNKKNIICGLVPQVKKWRMRFCLRAHSTIELRSGVIARNAIKIGDECLWQS